VSDYNDEEKSSLEKKSWKGVVEDTYYIACFHVSPSRLFTAEPMLKTRDANQKQLTVSESAFLES
jgi:hypothetical protein